MSLGCAQKQKRPHGEGVGPWLLAANLADELAFFRSGARRAC